MASVIKVDQIQSDTGNVTLASNIVLSSTSTISGNITSPTIAGTLNLTGGQIAFPATQNPSSDANTLDDYEEGTWTPNVYNSSSSSTFTGKIGYYRKIGSLVNCWFTCDYGNTGTSGSALILTGLPFSIGSFSLNPTWGSWGGNGSGVYMSVIRSGGGTTMALCSGGSDVTGQYTFITGCISYFTS